MRVVASANSNETEGHSSGRGDKKGGSDDYEFELIWRSFHASSSDQRGPSRR
jgi:hypothetical protein